MASVKSQTQRTLESDFRLGGKNGVEWVVRWERDHQGTIRTARTGPGTPGGFYGMVTKLSLAAYLCCCAVKCLSVCTAICASTRLTSPLSGKFAISASSTADKYVIVTPDTRSAGGIDSRACLYGCRCRVIIVSTCPCTALCPSIPDLSAECTVHTNVSARSTFHRSSKLLDLRSFHQYTIDPGTLRKISQPVYFIRRRCYTIE